MEPNDCNRHQSYKDPVLAISVTSGGEAKGGRARGAVADDAKRETRDGGSEGGGGERGGEITGSMGGKDSGARQQIRPLESTAGTTFVSRERQRTVESQEDRARRSSSASTSGGDNQPTSPPYLSKLVQQQQQHLLMQQQQQQRYTWALSMAGLSRGSFVASPNRMSIPFFGSADFDRENSISVAPWNFDRSRRATDAGLMDYDVLLRDYASPLNLRLRGCYGNMSVLLPENQMELHKQGYYDQDFRDAKTITPATSNRRERASYFETMHRKRAVEEDAEEAAPSVEIGGEGGEKGGGRGGGGGEDETSKASDADDWTNAKAEAESEDGGSGNDSGSVSTGSGSEAAVKRNLFRSSTSTWSRDSSSMDDSVDADGSDTPPDWMVNVKEHTGDGLWLRPIGDAVSRRESGQSTQSPRLSPPTVEGMDLLTYDKEKTSKSFLNPEEILPRNLLSPHPLHSSASSHEGTLTPRGSVETLAHSPANSLDDVATREVEGEREEEEEGEETRPRAATEPTIPPDFKLLAREDENELRKGGAEEEEGDEEARRRRSSTVPTSRSDANAASLHSRRRERRSSSLKAKAVDLADKEADKLLYGFARDKIDIQFEDVQEMEEETGKQETGEEEMVRKETARETSEEMARETRKEQPRQVGDSKDESSENLIEDSSDVPHRTATNAALLDLPILTVEEAEEIVRSNPTKQLNNQGQNSFRSESSGFGDETDHEENFQPNLDLDSPTKEHRHGHSDSPNSTHLSDAAVNSCCFCGKTLTSPASPNLPTHATSTCKADCASALSTILSDWKASIIGYQSDLIQLHLNSLSTTTTATANNSTSTTISTSRNSVIRNPHSRESFGPLDDVDDDEDDAPAAAFDEPFSDSVTLKRSSIDASSDASLDGTTPSATPLTTPLTTPASLYFPTTPPPSRRSEDDADSMRRLLEVLKASTTTLGLLERKQRRVLEAEEERRRSANDGDEASSALPHCDDVNKILDVESTETLIRALLNQLRFYREAAS